MRNARRKLWGNMGLRQALLMLIVSSLLAACTTTSHVKETKTSSAPSTPESAQISPQQESTTTHPKAAEVVLFAMGLLDTGYTFGGKNPEAGLDCSGLITYVYSKVTDLKLSGNAASIAKQGRPIQRDELRPGDLVFFNTLGATYSHAGIYVGQGKFVHATNSRGKVRIDYLQNSYYKKRFTAARSLFPSAQLSASNDQ